MIDYGLVILSYRRPREQVQRVLACCMQQAHPPAGAIVFHNAPSCRTIDGALNVIADRNLGCSSRHAAALLLPYQYYAFIDDDVLVRGRDVLGNLVHAVSDPFVEPHLVGIVGRDLAGPIAPYSAGREHRGEPRSVDVVKGWLHAATRKAVLAACALRESISEATAMEDDLCLSASATVGMQRKPMIIATKTGDFEHIRDDLGNERRQDHYARRDAAVHELRNRIGWRAGLPN